MIERPESGKAIIFRANAGEPSSQNEKKYFSSLNEKTKFIPSSEMECPKSGIFTKNYWVLLGGVSWATWLNQKLAVRLFATFIDTLPLCGLLVKIMSLNIYYSSAFCVIVVMIWEENVACLCKCVKHFWKRYILRTYWYGCVQSCSVILWMSVCTSARNGYPGTRVATRYPGTRSGPGYPVIFITRLLST